MSPNTNAMIIVAGLDGVLDHRPGPISHQVVPDRPITLRTIALQHAIYTYNTARASKNVL